MTFQTGNATETIAICAISIWFGWLVYRFHQREYVYEMTFEPGVLRANDRRFKLQDITSHGRSEMGGDVVVAGASLPQNFIVGPHLFISVDGRQLPITPPMKSDRAARLHRDFEALYDRYKAMPAD